MWHIIRLLFVFVVVGAAVIAIAFLWPDDDDDDDYWVYSDNINYYSGGDGGYS